MQTKHKIIIGDSRDMSLVEDKSVDLIITSPPYWQLKDYGSKNQIGYNDSYEEYINNLNLVWQECDRVLDNGCRLCINIGDQFARSVYYGRYKIIPIRTEIIRFCETIGLDFMGSIIWQKVTNCNTTGGASIMGSYPYPRNGIVKLDYEFILLFKKQGAPKKVSKEVKEQSIMTKEEWNSYFNGHWNFSGEKQNGHLAMFPEELPKRLIKMFSFVGETVLDPFLGSGTTTLTALKNNRNSIGYEINKDFKEIIKSKVSLNDSLFNKSEINFETIKNKVNKFDMSKLPYLFKDPVKLNKKIDPKKLNYGSKIDKDSRKRDEYFKVQEILDTNTIILNNDLKVKLLGILPNNKEKEKALLFLHEKIKGKQVYLKYDKVKFDDNNILLAYLYLKNKTFINAHLVKYGFASIDSDIDITNRTLLKLKELHA